LIASGGRGLGDQFGRQRVIKVGRPHATGKFKVQSSQPRMPWQRPNSKEGARLDM
jgi:hypothetical protein